MWHTLHGILHFFFFLHVVIISMLIFKAAHWAGMARYQLRVSCASWTLTQWPRVIHQFVQKGSELGNTDMRQGRERKGRMTQEPHGFDQAEKQRQSSNPYRFFAGPLTEALVKKRLKVMLQLYDVSPVQFSQHFRAASLDSGRRVLVS